MSTITLLCPGCKATIKVVATTSPGKEIHCPNCQTTFVVPFDEEVDRPPCTAVTRPRAVPPRWPPAHDGREGEDDDSPPGRRTARLGKEFVDDREGNCLVRIINTRRQGQGNPALL